ncbi:signal peptidase I [[Eubacterium] hominis]|uniref:signal peptidase I n=1 Tax=[Eubacterium] hominis TaxID=2764325 RepID=UPI003A4DADFC
MAGSKNRHTEESKETLGKVIASNLFSLLKIFLVCFVLVYTVVNFGIKPVRVYGGSMYPTLTDGSFALSNAFQGRFLDIERYDIVVAYDPAITKTTRTLIKRVIGLPGETIYAKDDVIYIDGIPLDEPYIANEHNNFAKTTREFEGIFTNDFGPVTLKEDEYFLMGDSRKLSDDSRRFGPFKRDSIKASGIFVLIAGKQ